MRCKGAAAVVTAADGNTHRLLGSLRFDGLYLVVGTVLWLRPGMLSHGVIMVLLHDRLTDYSTGHPPPAEWRWVAFHTLQALAGAAVALGAAGLVRLLHRMRGYPASSPATMDIEPDPSH